MLTASVYAIINNKTEKAYIGSTYYPKSRIQAHKKALQRKEHYNSDLQNDWSEDPTNFEFRILESNINPQFKNVSEQYWIDLFNSCYNINRAGFDTDSFTEILSDLKKRIPYRKISELRKVSLGTIYNIKKNYLYEIYQGDKEKRDFLKRQQIKKENRKEKRNQSYKEIIKDLRSKKFTYRELALRYKVSLGIIGLLATGWFPVH